MGLRLIGAGLETCGAGIIFQCDWPPERHLVLSGDTSGITVGLRRVEARDTAEHP